MIEIAILVLGYGIAQILAIGIDLLISWWDRRKPSTSTKGDGRNYTQVIRSPYKVD